MVNAIIKFSLNNRLAVLFCAVLLMVSGIYVIRDMDVDVFPDLNAPTVVVMCEANGMAPEEVERFVTFKIETAVNGATGVRRVRSSSTTGFSVVWVEFNWGTDIYKARQIVSEKLSGIREELPRNIGTPILGPQSSILGEVMIVGLTADSTSLRELRTLADWTLCPRLLAKGGVAQVAVIGGEEKEYQILLNTNKMQHYDVTLDDVLSATKEMNQNVSGGILNEYGNEYLIRGILATTNIEELEKTVVKKGVQLRDIAHLQIGTKSPQTGLASVKGRHAVLLTITKQNGANTLQLTQQLDQEIERLKQNLPKDVQIHTDIFRQSKFIESSISNIQKSLIEGGIFVVFVLFVFLLNVRTTMISLVSIPLSLFITILVLKLMGLTINTMSIGGMAIAIGSLVDDAVVDVENVFKRLRENRKKTESEKLPIIQCIFEASREVRKPILSSTLIIIVSFVPLFCLSGMEGRMLAPLGVSFIISLIASTLVALTLTPVLCSYFLVHAQSNRQDNEAKLVSRMKMNYEKALIWSIHRKKIIIGISALFFIVAMALFTTLGRSFLPNFNEGSLTINVSTLPGISLKESDKIGKQSEEILLTIPEIKTVARKTGRAELDEHALGVNTSEIEAPFELKERSKSEMLADIRKGLQQLPGVNIEIGQPISHRIDAMLSGTQANIAIKLFGNDLNQMFHIAGDIKKNIQDIEGVVDLNVEQQIERPELQITPRRDLLAQYGITPAQFASYVSILLGGENVSQIYEGNHNFAITVKADDQGNNRSIENLEQLLVDADGTKIPLVYIADIKSTTGPNTINREDVERKLVVSANVEGKDMRSVVNEIQEKINQNVSLPEGYHIEYGGQFESEENASRILLIASGISILIIFLLLYNQFQSLSQSAVVLLNLPLALIGGIFAIIFTGNVLSIPAIIGFISLFGIATRNGMLLIDRYNELYRLGFDTHQCVLKGSLDRMLPIIMTALTSALALIPLALGGDLPGNEIQSPMAKVMLGGLLSSTLLNGFLIPIMYLLIKKTSKKQNV